MDPISIVNITPKLKYVLKEDGEKSELPEAREYRSKVANGETRNSRDTEIPVRKYESD